MASSNRSAQRLESSLKQRNRERINDEKGAAANSAAPHRIQGGKQCQDSLNATTGKLFSTSSASVTNFVPPVWKCSVTVEHRKRKFICRWSASALTNEAAKREVSK